MYDKKAFPELKIEVLKRLAAGWAHKYPIIEKILLYRANQNISAEYVLVVLAPTYREKENTADEIINAGGEEIRIPSFCNWAQENCDHVRNDLLDAYINKKSFVDFERNWFWFNISSEREIPDEFIVPEFMLLLFTRTPRKKLTLHTKKLIQRACDEATSIYKELAAVEYKPEKWKTIATRKFDDACLKDDDLYDLPEKSQRKRNFINRFIKLKIRDSGIKGVTQKIIEGVLKSTLSR